MRIETGSMGHVGGGLHCETLKNEMSKMRLLPLTVLLFQLWVSGCAGNIMPISDGSQSDIPNPGSTAVVWGQHKGAVGATVTILQKFGLRIIERARLQQVFDEQKIRLMHSTDDDAQILKVGKILGAGSIVFVETETSSSQTSRAFVNQDGGGSHSETVTNASVSVRGVNVESGEVMWTGTAHYPQAINNPEAGIVYLTQTAVFRGLCPTGAWKNDTEGCDPSIVLGRGMMGFQFERRESPQGKQLIVTEITPGSPAEQAGLKVGDVLLSCNGRSGFQTRIQYMTGCRFDPGQPVTLQVKRADKLITISATAVSRTEPQK